MAITYNNGVMKEWRNLCRRQWRSINGAAWRNAGGSIISGIYHVASENNRNGMANQRMAAGQHVYQLYIMAAYGNGV